MSHIDPERSQFEIFKSLPRDVPINMINLIKLKEKADYADAAPAGVITGADAYAAYGRESGPIFQRVGGSIIWRGSPKVVLIGPESEGWDIAFIARYPHAGAFMEMVTDEDYKKAVKHRQAAVLDSRLIRCDGIDGDSSTFG